MRQSRGAAVALMPVCSQRGNRILIIYTCIYRLLTDYFWRWSAQCGLRKTCFFKLTDKWEGDWASTDFTSGRIVFSLLFPLSFFPLLCVWLCSCVHSFSRCKTQIDPQPPRWQPTTTTTTPPPRKRTQECHQKQMTFLPLFRANSRFIIGHVSDRFRGETKVLSPARVADGRVVLLWL